MRRSWQAVALLIAALGGAGCGEDSSADEGPIADGRNIFRWPTDGQRADLVEYLKSI
jgi:hypothetical protein